MSEFMIKMITMSIQYKNCDLFNNEYVLSKLFAILVAKHEFSPPLC